MKKATRKLTSVLIIIGFSCIFCAGPLFGLPERSLVDAGFPDLGRADQASISVSAPELISGSELASRYVKNEGFVTAKEGSFLASDGVKTLSFDNDGLIQIVIDEAKAGGLTCNEEGLVSIDMATVKNLFLDLVNTDELVQASAVVVKSDGVIALMADTDSKATTFACDLNHPNIVHGPAAEEASSIRVFQAFNLEPICEFGYIDMDYVISGVITARNTNGYNRGITEMFHAE